MGRLQVFGTNLRHEALQGLEEWRFVKRAPHFAQTRLPVFRRHLPEPRIRQRFQQIPGVDVELLIAFTREGEHRIGATLHPPADHAGKMHTEEGKVRVGYRIDEIAAEMLCLWLDSVVFAAEGDNLDFGLLPTQRSDAIRVQPGAIHHVIDRKVTRQAVDNDVVAIAMHTGYLSIGHDVAIAFLNARGQTLADLWI